jgi:hypothetical protein
MYCSICKRHTSNPVPCAVCGRTVCSGDTTHCARTKEDLVANAKYPETVKTAFEDLSDRDHICKFCWYAAHGAELLSVTWKEEKTAPPKP